MCQNLTVEFKTENKMIQLFLFFKHQIISYVSPMFAELNTCIILWYYQSMPFHFNFR